MKSDMWTYSNEYSTQTMDVEGFEVAATDGDIGKVDEATYDVGTSYIVVDTGPWIFGRNVVLPAGAIERVVGDNRKVVAVSRRIRSRTRPSTRRTPRTIARTRTASGSTYYDPYL